MKEFIALSHVSMWGVDPKKSQLFKCWMKLWMAPQVVIGYPVQNMCLK